MVRLNPDYCREAWLPANELLTHPRPRTTRKDSRWCLAMPAIDLDGQAPYDRRIVSTKYTCHVVWCASTRELLK